MGMALGCTIGWGLFFCLSSLSIVPLTGSNALLDNDLDVLDVHAPSTFLLWPKSHSSGGSAIEQSTDVVFQVFRRRPTELLSAATPLLSGYVCATLSPVEDAAAGPVTTSTTATTAINAASVEPQRTSCGEVVNGPIFKLKANFQVYSNTTYRLQVELMSSNFDGNPSSTAAAVPSIGELKQRVIAVGQAQIEMQTPRPTLFVEMPRDGDVVTVEAFMIIYWIRHGDGLLEYPERSAQSGDACIRVGHVATGAEVSRNCVRAEAMSHIRVLDKFLPHVQAHAQAHARRPSGAGSGVTGPEADSWYEITCSLAYAGGAPLEQTVRVNLKRTGGGRNRNRTSAAQGMLWVPPPPFNLEWKRHENDSSTTDLLPPPPPLSALLHASSDPGDQRQQQQQQQQQQQDAAVAAGAPCAFVTLLYGSDAYLPGTLALGQSLRDVGSEQPLVVLVGTQQGVPTVSREALRALRRLGRTFLELVAEPAYSEGSALRYLGAGIWIKMHMFRMVAYRTVVYLDADYLAVKPLGALFSVPRFAAAVSERHHYQSGEFAGGLMVVHPNLTLADAIDRSLRRNSQFLFGEQDFLNLFFDGQLGGESESESESESEEGGAATSQSKAVLPHSFGCIAEMLQQYENADDVCQVVHFQSCIRGWKPWQGLEVLREAHGNRVCRFEASDQHDRAVGKWEQVYARALSTVSSGAFGDDGALGEAAAKDMPSPPQIVVVGAHHTGTSLIARALIEMGIHGGSSSALLRHASNSMKYWERADVVELNQALLDERCHLAWGQPRNRFHAAFPWHGFGCSPPEWNEVAHARYRGAIGEAIARIVQSIGVDDERPWVTKDPRLSLTLDEWMPHLDRPICVTPYRRPLSFASSMMAWGEGFGYSHWLHIWEMYMTSILKHCPADRLIIVEHATLEAAPVDAIRQLYQNLLTENITDVAMPHAMLAELVESTAALKDRAADVFLPGEVQQLSPCAQRLVAHYEMKGHGRETVDHAETIGVCEASVKKTAEELLAESPRAWGYATTLRIDPSSPSNDATFATLLALVASLRAFDAVHPIYVLVQGPEIWEENKKMLDSGLVDAWNNALEKLQVTTIHIPSDVLKSYDWLHETCAQLQLERVLHIARASVVIGDVRDWFTDEYGSNQAARNNCRSPNADETCMYVAGSSGTAHGGAPKPRVITLAGNDPDLWARLPSTVAVLSWSGEGTENGALCPGPWNSIGCRKNEEGVELNQAQASCDARADLYWARVWRRLPPLIQSSQDSAPAPAASVPEAVPMTMTTTTTTKEAAAPPAASSSSWSSSCLSFLFVS